MKKIIVLSVALLIGATTCAYSLPLRQHDINQGVYPGNQGVYPGKMGVLGWAGQGFNFIPLLKRNKFPSSMFGGASNFASRHQIAQGQGMNCIPEWSHHDNNVGGTDPIPEPATIMLFGTGLIGLAYMGRRRMRLMKK